MSALHLIKRRKSQPLLLNTIQTAAQVGIQLASAQTDPDKQIFSLKPALSFALLFFSVRVVTQAALVFVGQSGFLLASALAALTGIDAATINVSELAGKTIGIETAVLAFILINAVNPSAKSVYSFIQGKREFAIKFACSAGIAVLVSLVGVLV